MPFSSSSGLRSADEMEAAAGPPPPFSESACTLKRASLLLADAHLGHPLADRLEAAEVRLDVAVLDQGAEVALVDRLHRQDDRGDQAAGAVRDLLVDARELLAPEQRVRDPRSGRSLEAEVLEHAHALRAEQD